MAVLFSELHSQSNHKANVHATLSFINTGRLWKKEFTCAMGWAPYHACDTTVACPTGDTHMI